MTSACDARPTVTFLASKLHRPSSTKLQAHVCDMLVQYIICVIYVLIIPFLVPMLLCYHRYYLAVLVRIRYSCSFPVCK